ncbi:class I SAM-dependent methyltransferase [Blastococcus haudaquaticus]|uniref:Methyltransferase domain-containing protein n=1 Tax=Blastococcus haudaquaticus TaxID=1938745 RepID=A0A286GI34_9ACTN|nr:class I SAM-dependent methyltransferase [Blastococcus haudaquaticus]SOD94634.1 Methyltransferase domain-containing protein [Blastococcus haudaquaticus]
MPPPERATRALARQLGHPRGPFGRLVGRVLNRRNAPALRAAVAALPVRPGDVLADLGFGGGVGLELLLGRLEEVDPGGGRVHGVDVSETMLAAASRRFARQVADGRLQLHLAPVEALPLADSSVDAAITLNTIYFLPDLPAAFREVHRVLRPGGRLVVGLGDPEAMSRMAVTREGFRIRPVDDVVDALGAAGLVLAEHRRVGEGEEVVHLLVAVSDAGDQPSRSS